MKNDNLINGSLPSLKYIGNGFVFQDRVDLSDFDSICVMRNFRTSSTNFSDSLQDTLKVLRKFASFIFYNKYLNWNVLFFRLVVFIFIFFLSQLYKFQSSQQFMSKKFVWATAHYLWVGFIFYLESEGETRKSIYILSNEKLTREERKLKWTWLLNWRPWVQWHKLCRLCKLCKMGTLL